MPKVSLTVNGQPATGEVEGRTLLVDFLRDGLDGKPVKSCTMLALEADGAEVKTIEGMAAPDGTLSPLQAAFREHHGLQCGFCTPGMVMSAAALLEETPDPTEAEVRHWLEGNLCRCTGYHNIVKAVLAAAE